MKNKSEPANQSRTEPVPVSSAVSPIPHRPATPGRSPASALATGTLARSAPVRGHGSAPTWSSLVSSGPAPWRRASLLWVPTIAPQLPSCPSCSFRARGLIPPNPSEWSGARHRKAEPQLLHSVGFEKSQNIHQLDAQ